MQVDVMLVQSILYVVPLECLLRFSASRESRRSSLVAAGVVPLLFLFVALPILMCVVASFSNLSGLCHVLCSDVARGDSRTF